MVPLVLCIGSGISHCRPPARLTLSVPLCWDNKEPPAASVGAHRHPWVVGTRGRCGRSGGRSPSLVKGGDGGSGPGIMYIVILKVNVERSIDYRLGCSWHRYGTAKWTVGVQRQRCRGGAVGMDNQMKYNGVLM